MMKDELATIKKSVRLIKAYALFITGLLIVICFSGFTHSAQKQNFDEITAKRIKIVDPAGKLRAILGSNSENVNRVGLLFYNEEGTESGALVYSGKRDKDGKIDAFSLLTMDQFKSDQIVVLDYDHTGDRKRYGLTINDRPDVMSAQAAEIIRELGQALKQADQSGKSNAEMDALRREYLSRIPAKEIVARRLFAGRDVEGSSLVTLSDPDGKPRLRLQVDKLGQASIVFLDQSGKVVRTIKP
jgi:uncharacterized protein YnzC (UPF0291/DUF896 family)